MTAAHTLELLQNLTGASELLRQQAHCLSHEPKVCRQNFPLLHIAASWVSFHKVQITQGVSQRKSKSSKES